MPEPSMGMSIAGDFASVSDGGGGGGGVPPHPAPPRMATESDKQRARRPSSDLISIPLTKEGDPAAATYQSFPSESPLFGVKAALQVDCVMPAARPRTLPSPSNTWRPPLERPCGMVPSHL